MDVATWSAMTRWRQTATTWVRKSAGVLRVAYDASTIVEQKAVVGWEAELLLTSALDDLEMIVPLIDPENLDQALIAAAALLKAINGHRLAAKMENTSGRTELEAAAFRAKAQELVAR